MKKTLVAIFSLFATTAFVAAQPAQKPLKKVMELKMPKTADDDMPGTRGASVAWHPVYKKYYASMAGNSGYPMAIFDLAGKRLSDFEMTTGFDTRGLWYNPKTKKICGNGYDVTGWFSYNLNSKGLISGSQVDYEGLNQPGDQCVGAFNSQTSEVMFLKGSEVYVYTADAIADKTITIHFGQKKADGELASEDPATTPPGYNNTTLVYTGLKGRELGFLNADKKQVELYDKATGFLTAVLTLPPTATAEPSFNFAYTNGMYWLFDMEKRVWTSYR